MLKAAKNAVGAMTGRPPKGPAAAPAAKDAQIEEPAHKAGKAGAEGTPRKPQLNNQNPDFMAAIAAREQDAAPRARGRRARSPNDEVHTPPKVSPREGALAAPVLTSSPSGSVKEEPIPQKDEDSVKVKDEDCVKVFVRIRPVSDNEKADPSNTIAVEPLGLTSLRLKMPDRRDPTMYTFDHVLDDNVTQAEVFDFAGVPSVDYCMQGFNSSVFAYGQTGAGKTYTMLGQIKPEAPDQPSEKRGIAPRVFESLFNKIMESEALGGVKYNCRCSFVQIYNEVISDLLKPSSTNLNIREDIKKGCYVEGMSEENVVNVDDVLALMKRGAENRSTGSTLMNAESSRSHSVFTCILEKTCKGAGNVTNITFSRLNLIDLAGSERIRGGGLGGSQVNGEHFKEACHINKSLTTLGRVINALVEAQRGGGKAKHVPYRDSRLTFLLQDSLGGNARTTIVANISPSTACSHESNSTLQFVRSAKSIRNKAVVNTDTRGDLDALQKELTRLKEDLRNAREGNTAPLIQECERLKDLYDAEAMRAEELGSQLGTVTAENARLKRERQRIEAKLTGVAGNVGEMYAVMDAMLKRMDQCETARLESESRMAEVHTAEVCLIQKQLQHSEQELTSQQAATSAATEHGAALQAQLELQQREAAVAQAAQQQLRAKLECTSGKLQSEEGAHAAARATISELSTRLQAEEQHNDELQQSVASLQGQLADTSARLEQEQEAHREANSLSCGLRDSLAEAAEDIATAREEGERLQGELQLTQSELAAVQQQLRQERQGHDATRAMVVALEQQVAAGAAAMASEALTCQELRAQLAAEQAEHGAVRGREAALEARVAELSAQLAAEQAGRGDAEGAASQLVAKLAQLGNDLAAQQAAHTELQAALGQERTHHGAALESITSLQERLQQQTEDLHAGRESLAAAQHAQQELNQQLQAAGEEAARRVAELEAARQLVQQLEAGQTELSQQLGASKEETKRSEDQAANLTQQLTASDAANAAARAAIADLESKLAALTAELNQHRAEHEEHVTTAAARLTQAQDFMEQRAAQIEALTEASRSAAEQHTSAAAELASRISDLEETVELLRGEKTSLQSSVDAHQAEITELKGQLAEQDRAAAEQKKAAAAAAADAAAQSAQHQQQISILQKELIQAQEAATLKDFEMRTATGKLTKSLEALKRDAATLQASLEERSVELATTRGQLAREQSALLQAQESTKDKARLVAELQRDLQATRQEAELVVKEKTAQLRELAKELSDLQERISDKEAEIKDELVRNARQQRAFHEIRRLIDWATTPPHSLRNSHEAERIGESAIAEVDSGAEEDADVEDDVEDDVDSEELDGEMELEEGGAGSPMGRIARIAPPRASASPRASANNARYGPRVGGNGGGSMIAGRHSAEMLVARKSAASRGRVSVSVDADANDWSDNHSDLAGDADQVY